MRRLTLTLSIAGLLLALAVRTVQSSDTGRSFLQMTIPTRTPTPTGGGGGGNGGGGDSGGGSGGGPTVTPTTAATAPAPPTPIGGYLPTAEACSLRPMAQARSIVNTRAGPGTDYPVAGRLLVLESRFITGRYGFGDWWQIALSDGRLVWVADFVVSVSGYTGLVPVLPAPPLASGANAGATPTPGPAWNPTPNPACAITVTPTATSSPTGTPPPGASLTPTPPPTITPPPTMSPTATVAPATSTTASQANIASTTTVPAPSPTVAPRVDSPSAGSGTNWLLYGGLGMVLLGAAGFFLLGRRE